MTQSAVTDRDHVLSLLVGRVITKAEYTEPWKGRLTLTFEDDSFVTVEVAGADSLELELSLEAAGESKCTRCGRKEAIVGPYAEKPVGWTVENPTQERPMGSIYCISCQSRRLR